MLLIGLIYKTSFEKCFASTSPLLEQLLDLIVNLLRHLWTSLHRHRCVTSPTPWTPIFLVVSFMTFTISSFDSDMFCLSFCSETHVMKWLTWEIMSLQFRRHDFDHFVMSVAKEGKVFDKKKPLQPFLYTHEGTEMGCIIFFLQVRLWRSTLVDS